MTAQYFTVLTDYGTQAFANAIATNQPIQFSSFAVGDGNGQAVTTTADRTALVKETHRGNVSAVSLDPRNNKQIIIELTIPEDVGGFYIREMGVFDSTNKLVAYANTPESFKPTLESGSGKVQVLRMILKVSNSQAVTLSIDNSVIFVTRQQLNPKKSHRKPQMDLIIAGIHTKSKPQTQQKQVLCNLPMTRGLIVTGWACLQEPVKNLHSSSAWFNSPLAITFKITKNQIQ